MEDLFGNDTTNKLPLKNRSGSFNINPCIAAFGAGPDNTKCKNCKLLKSKRGNSKIFYKCALRTSSNGPATDHKVHWPSCGQFLQCDNDGGLYAKEADLQQIKKLLLDGKRLTVVGVLRLVGTQELRTYIPILRRQHDMDISAEWQERGGKRFKEYYLKTA
jgi:hypothetical protein